MIGMVVWHIYNAGIYPVVHSSDLERLQHKSNLHNFIDHHLTCLTCFKEGATTKRNLLWREPIKYIFELVSSPSRVPHVLNQSFFGHLEMRRFFFLRVIPGSPGPVQPWSVAPKKLLEAPKGRRKWTARESMNPGTKKTWFRNLLGFMHDHRILVSHAVAIWVIQLMGRGW